MKLSILMSQWENTLIQQQNKDPHQITRKITGFDADQDAASVKTEDELSMKDDADQENAVTVSGVQVKESTCVNDSANSAAEDVVELRDVED